MKQLLVVLLICIVGAAQSQNFSPKVVEKLQKYNIDSLRLVLRAAPLTFKSKELTVKVKGVYALYNPNYHGFTKVSSGLFYVVLDVNDESIGECGVRFGENSAVSSWYIGDDNRNFDKYLSKKYLKQEYRQPIIDGISAWVLKLP